jgi:hypothetical protein
MEGGEEDDSMVRWGGGAQKLWVIIIVGGMQQNCCPTRYFEFIFFPTKLENDMETLGGGWNLAIGR